ncbi:MAG: Fic family protein [Fimbriimonadaceae bacterium]|nr:Fic family protein [Fimbriimonadaceae bacterium]
MPKYIYEQPEWPEYRWEAATLAKTLEAVRLDQGRLLGRLDSLGIGQQQAATMDAVVEEVQKSSEIEGEVLESRLIRSSVGRRLGLETAGLPEPDRRVDGVVEMALDAAQGYDRPLTVDRLRGWHAALFPAGRSGIHRIVVGEWRDDRNGPMQVVSGSVGREKVHFQAPPASILHDEMERFLAWFQGDSSADALLKAGIAHLWFVTIHPFDDGNGRIARAIADMALARSEGRGLRCYSLSSQIRKERTAYYRILEGTQKGGLDVTEYLLWFLECFQRALHTADETMSRVLASARFWQSHAKTELNSRQRTMLARLLEGFDGKLTNARWARMAKCSHDTALRDLNDLVGKGILERNSAGGRSTSYSLSPAEDNSTEP